MLLVLAALGMFPPSAAAQAGFGLVAGSVRAEVLNRDGTADTVAGSHPFSIAFHFDLVTDANGLTEARGARIELPPGLIGNPSSVAECSRQQFESGTVACPPDTQIGVMSASIPGIGEIVGPLYNIAPPPGYVAQVAFSTAGVQLIQYITLNSEGYGLRVVVPGFPQPPTTVTETLWGTPADPGHDAQRTASAIDGGPPVASEAEQLAYLTLPSDCGEVAPKLTVSVDSEQAPDLFVGESSSFMGAGLPAPLSRCEAVPFSPSISSSPSAPIAATPSGFHFDLTLPDQGFLGPSSISETEPAKAEVNLPLGMTINPSAANGLLACAPAQYAAESVESLPGEGCPEASKIGTLLVKTPLLGEAVEGSVYLASPHDNPFNSLLAFYIVVRAPQRGLLIKQAGLLLADPSTGQLTVRFDGLPPLPYSSFELDLHEGPRALLLAPQTCGTYTTEARLYPFSDPDAASVHDFSFTIGSGANGGPCSATESQLPNAPSLQAGTTVALAGTYSPLSFRVSREDAAQRFGSISATLPEGLLGRLAGIPYCPEAQIAAAQARGGEGEGAVELASPSCPAASLLGTVSTTAGAGSEPERLTGNVYLAGSYKGAPLSLVAITPVIAGPFDLGVVVVRVALFIDQRTAQIHAVSDPIPSILHGMALDVRAISVQLDRPGFTLNPTSCKAMKITGSESSTSGQTATLADRFQVGGCAALPFKPKLSASTRGNGEFAGHGASLHLELGPGASEANVRSLKVDLPQRLPARASTVQHACPDRSFAGNPAACPAASVLGSASVVTPLLSAPMTGPVYLVSHGAAGFPDIVLLLQQQGLRIELTGELYVDQHNFTSAIFRGIPDVPIRRLDLTLPEGRHSILVAGASLCRGTLHMSSAITAQDGTRVRSGVKVAVAGCRKSAARTHGLQKALRACRHDKGKRAKCERKARSRHGR